MTLYMKQYCAHNLALRLVEANLEVSSMGHSLFPLISITGENYWYLHQNGASYNARNRLMIHIKSCGKSNT